MPLPLPLIDEVQPPIVAKFLFGGVFAGAVLALSTVSNMCLCACFIIIARVYCQMPLIHIMQLPHHQTKLIGPRPFPKSSLLTLSTIHYASFIFCVPGVGYPTEGISEEWDSQVSKAGMVIHGVFGTLFALVYMRSAKPKAKGA